MIKQRLEALIIMMEYFSDLMETKAKLEQDPKMQMTVDDKNFIIDIMEEYLEHKDSQIMRTKLTKLLRSKGYKTQLLRDEIYLMCWMWLKRSLGEA